MVRRYLHLWTTERPETYPAEIRMLNRKRFELRPRQRANSTAKFHTSATLPWGRPGEDECRVGSRHSQCNRFVVWCRMWSAVTP